MCGELTVTHPRRSDGFTLVEMMIVTAVFGILLAIAVPNFTEWIANERVRSSTNDLYAGLMMARSEAMKRNVRVDLSRTSGSSTDWSAGWSVKLTDGTTFQTQDGDSRVAITGPNTGTVSYSPTGRPVTGSVDTQFSISATGYTSVATRYVCLTLSGMPVVKRTAC
ncbi:MAG: hypothetical protein CVU17_01660 [Betaproteobacteria bacterium HGW-Betaproteobacteria-11]|nr:MAG: hypothetical protein CVU17_01660 [Betaproteobacteria bacterium HGW-Betaproteobacteria-11]